MRLTRLTGLLRIGLIGIPAIFSSLCFGGSSGSVIGVTTSANNVPYGTNVTVSAWVAPPNATGTVTFYDGSIPLGSAILVPAGLSANASLTTPMLPPGNRKIVARYNGDSTYAPGISNLYTETILAGPSNGVRSLLLASSMSQPIIAAGDFNNDGKPDLVVAYPGVLMVFMGGGNGSNDFIYPGTPAVIAVADFNCDGKADIAVAGSSGVSVFLGDGTGNFQAAITDPVGNTTALAVADFNNDGKPDLVETGPSGVGVHIGNGDGTFQPPPFYFGPGTGVVGDFNNDGNADLLLFSGGAIWPYRGDGTGHFNANQAVFPAGPTGVVADFNGDGNLDVATSMPNGTLQVYLGNGNFAFQAPAAYATGPSGNLYVTDFNGDGNPDLVLAPPAGNSMQIFTGTPGGAFNAPVTYDVGGLLAMADFNLDGRVDFAAAQGDGVRLFLGDLAARLVFTTQPTDIGAGLPITPAVVAQVQDAGGNTVVTGGTVNITSSPAGINVTLPTSQGAATFNNLALTTLGSYSLTATTSVLSGGLLTSLPSLNFNVFPGPPANLTFPQSLPDGTTGVALPPVSVTVLDAYGNPTTGTIALTSFPAAINTTANAIGGVATFSGLVINTPGTYTLTASWNGTVFSLPSNSFSIYIRISGQVKLNGAAFSGVTVTLSGAQSGSATTDGSGNYAFNNITGNGTYVVTPSLARFLFNPQSTTFTNPATNQTANFTGWDALAGITTTSNGQIAVTNSNANRVEIFDSNGNLRSQYGSAGSGTGQFNLPTGATTSNGLVLVSDTLNNRVEAFDSYGSYRSQFGMSGSGMGQFNRPMGIASSGALTFVSDTFNNRVEAFDSYGNYRSQFGSAGSGMGQFNGPAGIAVSNNLFFIVDTGNNRIEAFDSNGNFRLQFGSPGNGLGQFNRPTGIMAANGLLYVADTGNNRVQAFDTNGYYRFQFGMAGAGLGQFNLPRGLTATSSGLIFVMDGGDNRVQAFDSYGNFRFQFTY